jgi:[acyl-carrier-protein] S-malonyltransferase
VSGLAILCPGQGGQSPEMLDLAAATPAGAETLQRCAAALGWDPVSRARAGGEGVYANAVAQPLVCAAEVATWEALRAALPVPRLVLGYSLGELAAYACAGALAAEEAVLLAVARAAAMDAAAPPGSGLLALRGLPEARAAALGAEAGAEVAIVNGPDHVVVGGAAAALAGVEAQAPAAGGTAVRIPVGVPAHTRLLSGAVQPFAAALRASPLRDPAVPVLAGTTALPVRTRAEAIGALSAALASPIQWARCLAAAEELGGTVFLELGPGGALARMAGELLPQSSVRSVADFRSVAGVVRWVERELGANAR